MRGMSVLTLAAWAAVAVSQPSQLQAVIAPGAGVVTGAGEGLPVTRATGGFTIDQLFVPYSGFAGEVRVAAGDINNDGLADIITGAGSGGAGGGHVKVFSTATGTEVLSFLAFDPLFTGGVFVAAGDVTADGFTEIVVGAGEGASHGMVRGFTPGGTLTSPSLLWEINAFPSFTGGARVAIGDVNGDGMNDVIAGPGLGGNGEIRVFSGATGAPLGGFFAFGAGFTGGVFVAAGDVTGNGIDEVIVGADAGAAGGHVRVFDGIGGSLLLEFLAFDVSFTGGARVAAADLTGDGLAEIIIGAGPGVPAGPVRIFQGNTGNPIASYFAYDQAYAGGVHVAAFVPEPATLTLLALGALSLTRRRRR